MFRIFEGTVTVMKNNLFRKFMVSALILTLGSGLVACGGNTSVKASAKTDSITKRQISFETLDFDGNDISSEDEKGPADLPGGHPPP